MKHLSLFKKEVDTWLGKNNKSKHVQKVMNDTGWSEKKVKEEMKKAAELGFTNSYYANHKLWAKTPEQLKKHAVYWKEKQEYQAKEREKFIAHIMEETGWSKTETVEEIREAYYLCGASIYDYTVFRMWELTDEEKKTMYTKGVFDKLFEKYNTDPVAMQTLVFKGRFAKEFSDLMNRRWFTNGTSMVWGEKFSRKIDGLTEVFAKPTASSKGRGAEKIVFSDFKDEREIYDYMKSKSYTLFEELIKQHSAINAINDSSVNTIRVITLVDNGVCHHLFTSFRIGAGKLVDNFSAGGIVADIDPETGIVRTDAFNRKGERFVEHPISGVTIKDFQIPLWDQVLELTETAALRMAPQGVGIVGWDVAVGEDKVYLVEGNSRPGHELPQLPYVCEKKGVKYVLDPYLPKKEGASVADECEQDEDLDDIDEN